MSRGRRALNLHSVEEWDAIVLETAAKVDEMAHAVGSRGHTESVAAHRRAGRWRDEAVEEQEHLHRHDGRDDYEVARDVVDRMTRL